jgi:hypothetical protein
MVECGRFHPQWRNLRRFQVLEAQEKHLHPGFEELLGERKQLARKFDKRHTFAVA